jgi:polyisoprenoid-binding protein YceI
MKKTFFALAFLMFAGASFAQKKTTSSATVSFDATTPKDPLPKATNNTANGSINTKTGAVAFEAMVASFAFSNPKIQEHFNDEKWMNSKEWPNFTFSGKITKLSDVNFSKNGTYTVTVSGKLGIKDKTKEVKTPVTVVVKDGKISATTSFTIKLKDFDIKGVPIDAGKVAPEPRISVSANF